MDRQSEFKVMKMLSIDTDKGHFYLLRFLHRNGLKHNGFIYYEFIKIIVVKRTPQHASSHRLDVDAAVERFNCQSHEKFSEKGNLFWILFLRN